MNIIDMFDPTNKEHLRMFAHVMKTSKMPEDFKEKVELSPLWEVGVAYKIAEVFINEKLNSKD